MRERERLLWGALIVLLLIIAGYMGYNVYRMGRQVREYKEAIVREALGSEDPQLRETVEQLEADLSDRMDYTFNIDEDPLELTQVIQGERFLAQLGFTESLEAQAKMRLSCTIITAGEPSAIVKFGGRSRILRVGDEIDGYRVTEIEQKRAVLISSEETLVLKTEKAPDTIEKERRMQEGPITVGTTESSPETGNF